MSPDLNPIEKMWSKVKAFLRKVCARTQETLYQAIADVLATVHNPIFVDGSNRVATLFSKLL